MKSMLMMKNGNSLLPNDIYDETISRTYPDNLNLTSIYNNSSKSFDFQYAVNGIEGTPFITGTIASYTADSGEVFNSVTVTTGTKE